MSVRAFPCLESRLQAVFVRSAGFSPYLHAVLLFCFVTLGGAGHTGEDPTLVLDERCYMGSYYQFDWDRTSPAPLKEAVEKGCLDKGDLRTIEKLTKARLAFKNIDWEKEDWRDHAVVRFVCSNAGIQPAPQAERFMNAPPPPEGWASPGFDDRAWPRAAS